MALLTALILRPDHFNGNEPVTQLYSRGAIAGRSRTVREGTGDLLMLLSSNESPANSPAQDITLASLSKEYNAQRKKAISA